MEYTLFYSGPFSQWYHSKFKVDGLEYNTAEQFMMAEKARVFGDKDSERKILEATHPRDQKELGRGVKNFDAGIWNKVARDRVYIGNYAKFSQNENLKNQLFATKGTILVEASPYDKIWGIGRDVKDHLALHEETWNGTNWLGEVLTKVREDMMAGVKSETFSWK